MTQLRKRAATRQEKRQGLRDALRDRKPGRPKFSGHPPAERARFRIPTAEQFARWMRTTRLGLAPRITLAMLAREVGLVESTVQRIEAGRIIPDLNTAQRIYLVLTAGVKGKLVVPVTRRQYVRVGRGDVEGEKRITVQVPPGFQEIEESASG